MHELTLASFKFAPQSRVWDECTAACQHTSVIAWSCGTQLCTTITLTLWWVWARARARYKHLE